MSLKLSGTVVDAAFVPADLHFSEQFLWMDEIIGRRAGGPPWLLSLRM
jgi:hypothetical protein